MERSRPRCECRNEDLWRWRFVFKRGVRPNGAVVTTPALDDDLGFAQRVEDFAVEQFVPYATSLTPIWRIASAILWPCETSTSTCLSLATISSGLYLFLGISVLLDAKRHTSSRTTSTRGDQYCGI